MQRSRRRNGESPATTVRLAILVALLAISVVPQARAEPADALPTDEKAMESLRLGNRLLDLGKWDDAIAKYEEGALLDPVPIFFHNIGLAHRKAGRYDQAIDAYRVFLDRIADDPNSTKIAAEIELIIKDMENAATRPPTEPLDVVEPSTAPSPRRLLTARRKLALGVGAVGLATLGAGLAFGLRADGFEDDAARLCPMITCEDAPEANALLERGQRNALYANIAYGAGLAAVIGATVLWFTGGESRQNTEASDVSIRVSPSNVGVSARVRF